MTCRDCGLEKLIVRSRRCQSCLAEYNRHRRRGWYEKNREHAVAYAKQYAATNRDTTAARGRAYHAANRDERNAQSRDWKRRNKARANELSRNWYWQNHDRAREQALLNSMVTRARQNKAAGVVTAEQLRARAQYFGCRCYLCGAPYQEMDHVKPLRAGGSNWPANLRPICRPCNRSKKSQWPYPFVFRRRDR